MIEIQDNDARDRDGIPALSLQSIGIQSHTNGEDNTGLHCIKTAPGLGTDNVFRFGLETLLVARVPITVFMATPPTAESESSSVPTHQASACGHPASSPEETGVEVLAHSSPHHVHFASRQRHLDSLGVRRRACCGRAGLRQCYSMICRGPQGSRGL